VEKSVRKIIEFLSKFKDREGIQLFKEEEQVFTNAGQIPQQMFQIYKEKKALKKQLIDKAAKENGDMEAAQDFLDNDISMKFLFLLDDLMGDVDMTSRHSILPSMMTKIRHAGVSTINCTHHYKGISPTMRLQQTHIIVFGLPLAADVKMVRDDVIGFLPKNSFNALYQEVTKQKYQFILILQHMTDITKKFCKGFDQQICL